MDTRISRWGSTISLPLSISFVFSLSFSLYFFRFLTLFESFSSFPVFSRLPGLSLPIKPITLCFLFLSFFLPFSLSFFLSLLPPDVLKASLFSGLSDFQSLMSLVICFFEPFTHKPSQLTTIFSPVSFSLSFSLILSLCLSLILSLSFLLSLVLIHYVLLFSFTGILWAQLEWWLPSNVHISSSSKQSGRKCFPGSGWSLIHTQTYSLNAWTVTSSLVELQELRTELSSENFNGKEDALKNQNQNTFLLLFLEQHQRIFSFFYFHLHLPVSKNLPEKRKRKKEEKEERGRRKKKKEEERTIKQQKHSIQGKNFLILLLIQIDNLLFILPWPFTRHVLLFSFFLLLSFFFSSFFFSKHFYNDLHTY